MTLLFRFSLLIVACLSSTACSKPSHTEDTRKAGDTAIPITLAATNPTPTPISPYLMGFNNSYFNDLDRIWKEGQIPERLKAINTGILRYPGGEETSRYHWETPGVNGYVDTWNSHHIKQKWQTTWRDPSTWANNKDFMDFEEYLAHSRAIGSELMVGINMSSGEVNDRPKDSLAEAIRWVTYCRDHDIDLTYVYLDNEPWHKHSSNYYHFPNDDYANLVKQYSRALKAINPKIKIIANALDSNHYQNVGQLKNFMQICGEDVDILDVHYYWEWSRASWARWQQSTPLLNSSAWRPEEDNQTFAQDIRTIRERCHQWGYDHVDIGVLEWNMAPPKKSSASMSHEQIALIQAEMFMQFIEADTAMACLWPMFWQVDAPEGVDNGGNRSIFSHHSPYSPTASYDMFSLFAPIMGGQKLVAKITAPDIYALAATDAGNTRRYIYLLNKSPEGAVHLSLDALTSDEAGEPYEILQLDSEGMQKTTKSGSSIGLPPYSLTRVALAR